MIQTEYGLSKPWYWPAIAPFELWKNRREGSRGSLPTDIESVQPNPPNRTSPSGKAIPNMTIPDEDDHRLVADWGRANSCLVGNCRGSSRGAKNEGLELQSR